MGFGLRVILTVLLTFLLQLPKRKECENKILKMWIKTRLLSVAALIFGLEFLREKCGKMENSGFYRGEFALVFEGRRIFAMGIRGKNEFEPWTWIRKKSGKKLLRSSGNLKLSRGAPEWIIIFSLYIFNSNFLFFEQNALNFIQILSRTLLEFQYKTFSTFPPQSSPQLPWFYPPCVFLYFLPFNPQTLSRPFPIQIPSNFFVSWLERNSRKKLLHFFFLFRKRTVTLRANVHDNYRTNCQIHGITRLKS